MRKIPKKQLVDIIHTAINEWGENVKTKKFAYELASCIRIFEGIEEPKD